jgi:AAA15 family ATPase/GTPase
MNNEKSLPMYFASLEIENIKCFGEKQSLNLRDDEGRISRWTLILGDNGVGKTTLLKCLSWMKPVKVPPPPPPPNSDFPVNDMKSDENTDTSEKNEDKDVLVKPLMDDFDESEFEQLLRVGNNVKTKIKGTFSNGVELGQVPSAESLVTVAMNFEKIEGELKIITPESAKLQKLNSPTVFAYSASRHMALKNFEKPDIKDPLSNLFSISGDLYDAEEVLSNLNYASISEQIENQKAPDKGELSKEGKATALLAKVKQILKDLLPDIESTDWIIINPPLSKTGERTGNLVEIQTPYGKVPLYELSLGYKTMLAWTVDLALRMLWRHPEVDNPLDEPAVVIVDEIDLHLHPKWQRIIRTYLTNHFKNTQFICTAHSPIMAQSSDSENLSVLKKFGNEVHIENNPSVVRGWRIGQVLTSDLFGISERSPEVEKEVNERRGLLDKENLTTEDEEKLKILNDELSKLPITNNEEDQNLLDKINKAAKLLTDKGLLNDKD